MKRPHFGARSRVPGPAFLLILGLRDGRRRARTRPVAAHAELVARVRAALLAAAGAAADSVHIRVFGRTVRLSGFVGSAARREQATDAVAGVDGVARVHNLLNVRSSGPALPA